MLAHKGTVPLHTERLLLRPLKVDDAEAMFMNWANDPEVTRYLMWHPHQSVEVTRTTLEKWQEEYLDASIYNWGIEYLPDNTIIGTISINDVDGTNHRAYIGYCIGQAWWGRGIVTEALRVVLDFGFREIGFQRLAAFHAVSNAASGRVMEKAGMQREGILRQYMLGKDGKYADCALWAAVREP